MNVLRKKDIFIFNDESKSLHSFKTFLVVGLFYV